MIDIKCHSDRIQNDREEVTYHVTDNAIYGFGMRVWGGQKIFGITHSYQKDTILYIGISVISNIHLTKSLF